MRRWFGDMRRLRLALLLAFGVACFEATPSLTAAPSTPTTAVWGWGANHRGQLGFCASNYHVPNELLGLQDVVSVAAGDRHTLALKSDGTVWAWGENSSGQLGRLGPELSFAPTQVADLLDIVEIVAGDSHNLARRSDGAVFAWGSNSFGQLGQPLATTASATPLQVALAPASRLAAGASHSMAIDQAGVAWAWGVNVNGQLGDGTTADTSAPVRILVDQVVDIAGGAQHALALDAAGDVWVWGLNGFGQLGRGFQGAFTQPFPVPERVPGPSNVVDIAAGDLHSLAVTAAGRVWVWGYNAHAQAGIGETTAANTGLLSAVELDLEGVEEVEGGDVFSLALTSDGDLYAWGNGARGSIGQNRAAQALVPTRVARDVSAVSAGEGHTIVLAPSRGALTLSAAGRNRSAQLGDGTRTDSDVLVDASQGLALQRVSAGATHGLGVDAGGRVWAWGSNEGGQLGVLGGDAPDPLMVEVPLGPGQRMVDVAAGARHSLALRSDGAVFSWGTGLQGQLGTGSLAVSPLPVLVPSLDPVVGIAAGDHHSLVITRLRNVFAFGDNTCGQLGPMASGAISALPVPSGLNSVSQVAAGSCHSLALRSPGYVFAWGRNALAELGDGSLRSRSRPEATRVPIGATAISAGSQHGFAIVEGVPWGWGRATEGQIGAFSLAWEPRAIPGMSEAVGIVAGGFHGLAVDVDGQVWGWGDGLLGQLGNGQRKSSAVPVPIVTAGRTVQAGAWHSIVGF